MEKIFRLIFEMWQISREGTWLGTARYMRFKHAGPIAEDRWAAPAGPARGLGIVGAGTYLASIHLPTLRALGEPLYAVASRSGVSARALAKVYGIGVVHPGLDEMIADPQCEALLIASPHFLHPEHILTAVRAGRYTYCEKPVAIDTEGVERLAAQALTHPAASKVMIGFNRRFSPAVAQLKRASWLQVRCKPMEMHYRVNFGPRVDNAMSDPDNGGGRIHGAACHYVDMMAFLAGAPIVQVSAIAIGDGDDDTFAAAMKLADGSVASLTFTSEGRRELDTKEELMISCDGHTARIRNYAELHLDGRITRYRRRCYGALEAMRAFLAARNSNAPVPVSLADGVAATRVTLAIQASLRRGGEPVPLPGN
jgi:polar amino acid transport system substrate-binding protein